jgi:hypothetical protein
MHPHSIAAPLRNTLAEASDFGSLLRDPNRLEDVRHQVLAVVDHLSEVGWSPERIVVGLKQIAKDGGLTPSMSLARLGDPLTDSDMLLALIVRWGIDHYFDTTVGRI